MAAPPLGDVVVVVPTTNPRKRKLGSGGDPRKPKFMKKILDDDKATKTTSFKKRLPTLMTKSFQLETLCDVSVCVLCYGSDGKVQTWPKDRAEAEARVLRYKKGADKDKRESNVVALLESTKRSLLRKVAKEVSACFSDLADDGERLDNELKRLEEKIRVMTSNGDQRNMDVAATSIFDDDFICLDDLAGPNFVFDPSLLGEGDSGGIGFGDLGLVENEWPNRSEPVNLETLVANMEDDVFLGLPDINMGHIGVDSRKVENFGKLIIQDNNTNINCPVVVDNYYCTGNGTSCTFDHTIVGPNSNCNNSKEVEDFGTPIQVTTNNSLPVGDTSCMKNCCSLVDDYIYLDDIVGPNFTFGGSSGIDPSLYGGVSAGIGFGAMEFNGFCL